MIAAVQAPVFSAITRGSSPSGATIGGSARAAGAMKDRLAPNSTAITKIGQTAVGFDRA